MGSSLEGMGAWAGTARLRLLAGWRREGREVEGAGEGRVGDEAWVPSLLSSEEEVVGT